MAEKFEQNLFLQEINQAIKSDKCFKLLLESSTDLTELLFLQKFTDYCENVHKKLEKYELQKPETNVLHKYERNISIRDDIVCNLDILWNICRAGLKPCVCPTFLKLFKIICKENGCLFRVLRNCLNCHDHFIAFQSYKVLCEVCKCFPNSVMWVQFEKLLNMSLSDGSENCSKWLPVYTAEIIKCLFIHKDSSESHKTLCCCMLDEGHSDRTCAKEIRSALCCHWLKLTYHFLARLSTVLKAENSVVGDVSVSKFDPFQQILITMLSYGKLFIESFDLLLANQNMNVHAENVIKQTTENSSLNVDCEKMDLQIGETSKSAKRARICGNENLSNSELHSCQMCQNAIFKDDYMNQSVYGGEVRCTHDYKLKVFLEKIVIQLVEIDHKKCLLHFSRTVFQFLNDFVSAISERCVSREKTNFVHEGTLWTAGVCSVLVESGSRLLGSIPQVMGEVHFGGKDHSGKQETLDVCSHSYDEVSLRKVLLLVLKLMLVTLRTQNDSSRIIESWLNFVTEVSHPELQSVAVWLVQLFSEQDDELIYLLFSLLQLYQELFCGKSLQPVPSWANRLRNSLNPHDFFTEFLTSINYDHSLLLDFLISNETHFLSYFHNYLRHLANDWHGFIENVERRQVLSKEERLQPSGTVQVPKGDGSEFSCCSTKQFCGTVKPFSADGGDHDDGCGDDVYGGFGGDGSVIRNGGGDDDGGDDGDDVGGGFYDGHEIGYIESGDGGFDDGNEFGDNDDGNGVYDDSDGCDEIADDSDDNDGDGRVVLSNMNKIQQTLTCLIRLRYAIERMSSKGLFPYPVAALVKVMKYIETLYEGEG
ncbi:Hypothetical predicted protein [Paramuricea clavata]|uniref:Uncharacterized protein n=1 Tax=Paramuricea clavata TaxID=317549 RepID=A0A6S7I5J5_PARCT|nr:Hypothetical predicted protein [Paramuricea clavata]